MKQGKTNKVLPRECTGHSKHPLPTPQEMILHMDITRWSIPKSDWSYSLQPKMVKLYTVSKNKTRSLLWLRPQTPYCQIHTEIEKKKKKKDGKPLMIKQWNDNWIQGISSDRQSSWRTTDGGSWHCTGGRDQDHPQEKEIQKGKIIFWGGLTNNWEKKRSKRQRRKGKIFPFECRFTKKSKEK